MALTDTQLRNAKPEAKDYTITDGQGLSILITSTGGKWWRFRYRHLGKSKLMSMGTYPEEALMLLRSDPAIKQAGAQLFIDDIAHVNHIREILVEASEHLQARDVKSAAQVMRGAAAYSAALKNTSDMLQKHFGRSQQSEATTCRNWLYKS